MDVRKSAKKNAILNLQKQLGNDLFRKDVKSMKEFNECFDQIRDRKVLIVIDDVDKYDKFDQLIPDINKPGPGSRVIVTSRESSV
jgi:leucine-rich repeat protein SHOC2